MTPTILHLMLNSHRVQSPKTYSYRVATRQHFLFFSAVSLPHYSLQHQCFIASFLDGPVEFPTTPWVDVILYPHYVVLCSDHVSVDIYDDSISLLSRSIQE